MSHPNQANPKSVLENFAAYLKLDRGLSPKTIEAYTGDLGQFFDLAPKSLSNLQNTDVIRYLETLTKQGVGRRSLGRKISSLRLFFKFAIAQNWCAIDPTENLEVQMPQRPLPQTLSFEEVEALLNAPLLSEPIDAKAQADAIMLRVLYSSGLRVSELVGLKHENLDLQSGILRIQGKGQKVRIVPIDAQTTALLIRYQKEIRPQIAPEIKRSTESVFLSQQGRPYTRQGFWKLLKKYVLLAGLPAEVSPHVLRHAFATHLLSRGMNLRSLQLLLGHSDISTTEIYSHVSKPHLHETLRKHHPKSR